MLKTIIIIDCYQRRFRDRYRYKENAYIGDQYDTDPIIGGTLMMMPLGKISAESFVVPCSDLPYTLIIRSTVTNSLQPQMFHPSYPPEHFHHQY